MDKDVKLSETQSSVQKGVVKVISNKKSIILFFLGVFVGLLSSSIVYFFVLDRGEKVTESNQEDTTQDEDIKVDPNSFTYDDFVDSNNLFTFKYPSNVIRMNTEDIDKNIISESKEKFKTEVLFMGVLQDNESVLQISANSYQFDKDKSLDVIFDELMGFTESQDLSYEILEKNLIDSGIEIKMRYKIQSKSYYAHEKILTIDDERGIRNGFSLSVTISEEISEKYKKVAEYIIKELKIITTSENNLNQVDDSGEEIVNDIYLAKFPKGGNSPTNAEGVTQTNSFDKDIDLICLVTDLDKGSSGFTIEVFDKSTNNLVTSSYNTSLMEGLSSGCNEINFGPGDFILKFGKDKEIIKEIEFEVK